MAKFNDAWSERRRRIAMRPNAHLYIRHDAWRFMPPGAPRYSGRDVVKYFWPEPEDERGEAAEIEPDPEHERAVEAEIAELRRLLASLRLELALQKLGATCRKYNPDQPRALAGSPQGGQWASEGAASSDEPRRDDQRVRLAASEKLPLGPLARIKLAIETAKKLIEAFRSENGLYDLFRNKVGAVTVTTIDGKDIYGSNSRSPLYETIDRVERDRMIVRYVEMNPDMEEKAMLMQMPVDAFSHAETNVLLRAARNYGGTLEGRTLDVFGDRQLCNNCEKILPFVGKELGNPTVTFFDSHGEVGTIRDGIFYRKSGR